MVSDDPVDAEDVEAMSISRVSPETAHERVRWNGARLICGYPPAMCRRFPIEGAVPVKELDASQLPEDAELIVYCS